MKNNTLFARIDPRIKTAMSAMTYDKIHRYIEDGRVIGNTAKSKKGGAGIVPCSFFYNEISGKVKQSMLKVKYGNVRVYGERTQETTKSGSTRNVIVFNGVDLRVH